MGLRGSAAEDPKEPPDTWEHQVQAIDLSSVTTDKIEELHAQWPIFGQVHCLKNGKWNRVAGNLIDWQFLYLM